MISIKDVRKDYQDGDVVVNALRGVSVDIEGGEFVSIAGPSGSGKTTLLNIIGCIDTATSGTVRIDDEDMGKRTQKQLSQLRRNKIGFVFQSFNLIPVLSAYENVAFCLSLLNCSERETRERTMRILAEVGLAGMEERRPSKLSGGQQQRVAVARALVKQPKLVLADEPTANLDSGTGEDILKLMRQMNEQYQTTFVFSTHDQMVMDYAKRLVMVHDGTIASDERRTK